MAEMSWRNTMRRVVRDIMTGSAATAVTNVASEITSRIRRGAAKSTTTVPPQQLSTPLVTNEFASELWLSVNEYTVLIYIKSLCSMLWIKAQL
jgi:hypothetical protein